MTIRRRSARGLPYAESLLMSKVTSFPRPALRRQAFVVVILYAVSLCLIWATYRFGAALEGYPFPAPWQMVLSCAFVLGFILWKASRRPGAEIRSWIKLRILWRRRRWVALFGFPCAIMLFSSGLGVICATSHWFNDPPAQAAQTSLIYAIIFGLAGFYGGFALHLPGGDGPIA